MMKNYEALASANKETVDACMQLNAVLVRGCQDIGNQLAALAQSTIEMNMETCKAVASIRSPQELVELQTKWIGQLFNAVLSGSAMLSEISTKVTGEVATPVQSHFRNVIGKMADHMTNISEKAA